MSIQIKDIQELIESVNQSGGAFIAVAMPDGIGGYNLRKITKSVMLSYGADAIPTRADGGVGNFRVLNMKGTDMYLEVIGAANAVFARGADILGISPDGSIIPARLESDGTVQGERMRINNAGALLDILFQGTVTGDAIIFEAGTVIMGPKLQTASPSTGGTVNATLAFHRLLNLQLAGTLATLTINFPTGTYEGQKFSVYFSHEVTALTLAAGGTILGNLTSVQPEAARTWTFFSGPNAWIPV